MGVFDTLFKRHHELLALLIQERRLLPNKTRWRKYKVVYHAVAVNQAHIVYVFCRCRVQSSVQFTLRVNS